MSKYLGNSRIDNLKGTTSVTTTVNGKSASQSTYSTPVLPFTDNNIIVNFPFKDFVTTDISGNSYTLTNNGSVTQVDITDTTSGITMYNAAGFNGSDKYLSRNTASDTALRAAFYANYSSYTGGYTLSAWVYTNNTSAAGEIFCATNSAGSVTIGTNQVYTIYMNSSGSLFISINGASTAAYLVGSYAINQSQWYHVVFIVAMQGNYLYINGAPVSLTYSTGSANTGLTQSILSNINRIYIGNRATTNYWNGYIKNVIFTTTIWTTDQVKQVYYSQLHDINTYSNAFFGFTNDNATGLLRQKNSTISLIGGGQSYLDVSPAGVNLRNTISPSIYNGGLLTGGLYAADTLLNEPPALSSNIQSYTTGASLSYTYEASASSTINGSSGAYAAFDNNTGTYYADNTAIYNSSTGVADSSGASTIIDGVVRYGSWLQIDMGRRITAQSFTILPRGSFETTRGPNLFYICGSNDNSTWSSIYTSTQDTITWAAATQTFTISTAHSYRYFRMVVSIVGNSGVSSGRTAFNIAQLVFTRKANAIMDGSVSIGSNTTNYLTYSSSALNGIIMNLNVLTYTDSSAAGTLANMNFGALRQMTFSSSNARTVTNAAALYLEGAPIKAGNTTFTNLYNLYIDSAATTSATVTEAASLYVAGAPTVTGGTTYALKVNSGINSFGGTTVSTSSATGNIINAGGMGIGANLWLGSNFSNVVGTTSKEGSVFNITALTFTNTDSAGTSANNNIFAILQPTIASTNAIVTTNASTAYIGGAPILGNNEIFTNAYGLYIDSGSATGATVTEAASLYVAGAPTISGGTAYALKVNSGKTYLGGSLQIPTGAVNGYILTSDASGNAAWAVSASSGGFSDGDYKTPGIYFTSESGTGLFRIGTNNIGLSLGATKYIDFSTSAINFSGTTASTSSTTGNIINAGGVGIAKNLWLGSNFSNVVGTTSKEGSVFNITALTFTNTDSAGTSANNNIFAIRQPTIASTNAIVTTNASTAYIGGAPILGNNETFTNAYGLYIDSGSATGATVTEAASLCVAGAPTISGGTAYALKVNSGTSLFGGNTILSPYIITGTTTPQTLSATASAHLIILNTSGFITLNLPTSPPAGTQFKLINSSTFTVTLNTNSASVYFDGTAVTAVNMAQYDRVHLVYYSNMWYTF